MRALPYQNYKDSGLDWLGKIPEHWKLQRLGQYFDERREKVNDVDYPPLSVTKSGIVPQLETAAKSDAGDNRKRVAVGDFVINSRSDRKGSSGVSALDGSVSLISIVLEPRDIDPRFVHHLLRSYPFQEEFYRFGKGIVADLWSTNYSEMKNINLPIPSPEEQTQIANFLDRETAKIDTLIEKQQQLIKLLQEKRQAVISHAVTKGLNPNAKMKDSGVEWLGEVPEHWNVSRIKRLAAMAGRIGYRGYTVNDIVDEGKGAIVLSPANINDRGFTLHKKVFLSWEKYYESPEIMVELGDILLVKTSWSFGKVAIVSNVDSPMTINPQMVLLKFSKTDPRFLSYFLNTDALQAMIFTINTGSYMPTMTQENIGDLPVFVPPLKEAIAIANHLDESCRKFNMLLDKQKTVIKLLNERRSALISAAVTGKIDVRHHASHPTGDLRSSKSSVHGDL